MSKLEKFPSSVDPTLRLGSTVCDDELLQRVPPEVMEALGPEQVQLIEEQILAIEQTEALRNTKNPFKQRGVSEIDLSFLDGSKIAAIEKFGQMSAQQKRSTEIKTYLSEKEVETLLKIVGSYVRSIEGRVGKITKKIYRPRDKTEELEVEQVAGKKIDLELIEGLIHDMRTVNDELPSLATFDVLEGINDFYEFYSDRLEKDIRGNKNKFSSRRRRIDATVALRINPAHRRVLVYGRRIIEKGASQADEVRQEGNDSFERLFKILKSEKKNQYLELLRQLSDAMASLPRLADGLTDKQMDALVATEEYVNLKAGITERGLKQIDPELSRDPAMVHLFGELQATYIAETERQLRLNRAAGLNRAITEANYISIGGRRLKPTRNVPKPAKISDAMEELLKDEEDKAVAPRGLIMAILTDRLPTFIDTVKTIQQEDEREITRAVMTVVVANLPLFITALPVDKWKNERQSLQTVKAQRGDVIQRLQRFDLDGCMEQLWLVMEYYRKSIGEIVSEAGLKKIDRALAKFYGSEITGETD